jgi:hypothetical protein
MILKDIILLGEYLMRYNRQIVKVFMMGINLYHTGTGEIDPRRTGLLDGL